MLKRNKREILHDHSSLIKMKYLFLIILRCLIYEIYYKKHLFSVYVSINIFSSIAVFSDIAVSWHLLKSTNFWLSVFCLYEEEINNSYLSYLSYSSILHTSSILTIVTVLCIVSLNFFTIRLYVLPVTFIFLKSFPFSPVGQLLG